MLAGNKDITVERGQRRPYLLSSATLCISKVPPIINYWAEEKQVPASPPEIPVSRVEYVFLDNPYCFPSIPLCILNASE